LAAQGISVASTEDDELPLTGQVADALARQRWGWLAGEAQGEPAPVRRETVKQEDVWRRALNFAREHLVVLGVALVVGLVFAVTTFWTTRPQEVPITPSVTASVITATPTPTSVPMIKIHVLGAVVAPGVVTLPQGSRVEDAITAAGGLLTDADPAQLNMAAVLSDGSQIVIGTTDNPLGDVNDGTGGSSGSGGSLVNLNTATQAQLETLPGVGPVTAGKILAWRTQHGRFSSVSELLEVDGIGEKTLAQLEPHVCV